MVEMFQEIVFSVSFCSITCSGANKLMFSLASRGRRAHHTGVKKTEEENHVALVLSAGLGHVESVKVETADCV